MCNKQRIKIFTFIAIGFIGFSTLQLKVEAQTISKNSNEITDLTFRDRIELIRTGFEVVDADIPYEYGGKCKTTNIEDIDTLDCSGLIDFIYRKTLDKDVGLCIASFDMVEIEEDDLQIGDLATIKKQGAEKNHIVMYAGKNRKGEKTFINASTVAGKVIYTNYDQYNYYYKVNFFEED